MSLLAQTIAQIPIADTHEHLITPAEYAALAPDIITALFGTHAYIQHDLISAGCSYSALDAFLDQHNHDLEARWELVAPYWQHCQHTGYGEAVRLSAHALYGIVHLDGPALVQAAPLQQQYNGIAGYQKLIALANLSQIQVDAFTWEPPASPEIPSLQYDLNIQTIVDGSVSLAALGAHTGVAITNIDSYRAALQRLIAMHANHVVALKTQHAYTRTLAWSAVDDTVCEPVVAQHLAGIPLSEHDAITLGDWAFAVLIQSATSYWLPIKIHTGHHAGNGAMPLDWVSPVHLIPLLRTFRDARFVCMHIGYPFHDALLSMAKHYANVSVDLCWAWSIDPIMSMQFVRQWIHSVPINKLFGFGGDAFLPTQTFGFALQARAWLTRTLQAEVDARTLEHDAALSIARALLSENQQTFYSRA
jgi:predicted TIM-barrel fold metal-dependent hydrolase